MFGADATMQAWYDSPEPPPDKTYNRNSVEDDRNSIDYMFPKFSIQRPWLVPSNDGNHVGDDFILIAEFSEQEGPRPLIVIPKDGGQNFDKNEFSVKILSVDHQSSFVEGCHSTEDAQVVMSDTEKQVHAFVHHLILNDIQARGYVRPFCISYVTSDQRKLMACYEDLSQQMKKVARLMKYGNRLVFMRDLEKHQEDLSYTKARLLITQSYMTTSTPQGDSDLFNVLNALRQSMEEVRDILSKLKPLLNDHELEERFQQLEKLLKISVSNRSNSLQDSSSLKDFDYHTSQEDSTYGSFTDTLSPEFSLFNKSKDQKPKFLDVSIIKGKRRFDRSLRGLHELCSWGAKDGLQRLRHIREFFKRDLSSIEIDDMDSSILAPDSGVLSFGTDCIGANFLSSSASWKGMGWKKNPYCRSDSQDNPISLGSLDSFKSLSSSFQSFVDEEMYSAKSSMIDTQSNGEGFISISDRLSSRDSIDIDNSLNMHNHITNDVDIKSNDTESAQTVDELDTTLNATLLDFVTETMNDSVDAASRPRTSTTISEFDVIDKDIDVKCNSRICSCSKENSGLKNKKVSGKREIGGLKVGNDVDVLDLADTTATMKDHSPNCDYHANDIRYVNGKEGDTLSNINERILEAGDSMKVKSLKSGDKTVNVDFYLGFSEDVGKGNVSDTMDIERFNCDKYSENSAVGDNLGVLLAKSEGISEAFLPHTQYSINEISSDLVGTTSNADQYQNTVKDACDENKTDVQNYDGFIKDSYRTSHNDECTDRTVENSGELKESYGNNSEGITEAFQPHLQFSINEDLSDISVEPIDSENRSKQDSDKLKTDNSFNSNKNEIMDAHVNQIKLLDGMGDCEYVKGKLADETGIMLDYSVDADKFKENNGPINGLWRGDGNITCSSTERSLEEETRHRRIRKKWRLTHPLKELADSSHFKDHGLLKILTSYNNLQHVMYSLLSGRPVVVIGTRKQEAILKELLQALNVFVPVVPGCDHVSLLCQLKQLKVVDVHRFLLRGIIRSEKKCLDYIVPQSLRRYITLFDVEKSLISCIPYQGSLLSFISAIYHKKKVFKTEQALHTFIQMCLMEISSKAFSFYHCMCIPDMETNYVGVTLTRKSSMLELSADKYLNKAGLLNADSRIIKHLAEIVKIQQIDEEFKCRSLTESPVYPFNIAYNTVQTFRC